MGILTVIEDWQGLNGGISTGGTNETIRRCVRNFTVDFSEGDIPCCRPHIACDDERIPKMWETHPYDDWMYVIDVHANATEGPLTFRVVANYSYVAYPLEAAPVIEWRFATSNEPVDKDAAGDPIINTVEESPDPPITKEVNDLILRYTRNEEFFDTATAKKYKGAVNEDVWTVQGQTFQPGEVRCNIFDGRQTRAAGLVFWQVTYEFQIRDNPDDLGGWKLRFLNQGFREKTGTETYLDDEGIEKERFLYATIKDAEGSPLSQPTLLDGDGKKIPKDGNPWFMEYDIFKKETFNNLGLG